MLETLKDLWLSAKGIKFYKDVLSRSQFWSADEMRDYQYQHLKALLISCYKTPTITMNCFGDVILIPIKIFPSLMILKRYPC